MNNSFELPAEQEQIGKMEFLQQEEEVAEKAVRGAPDEGSRKRAEQVAQILTFASASVIPLEELESSSA